MAICQGHGNIIQYIFPDMYFLRPIYHIRFSVDGFERSLIAVVVDAAEANWKHKVILHRGGLITL